MVDNSQQARAVSWYYFEHFGFSKAPPQTDMEVVRNMAFALITAASGDGHLSAEERGWIIGYCSAKGYPSGVVEEISGLDAQDIDALPLLMQLGILRQSGRILIYDAIRACSVDGYNAGEKAAVRNAARILGIDEESVEEIERLVADEQALKSRRIKLLMPTGHPNLDPRYLT